MFDLISIGDCVIDTFVPLEKAPLEVKSGVEYLMLPFGQKIPVEQSSSMVGGNAANNAVGSARLKLKVAIYTNVGKKDDDVADERIVNKFKKEGIDVRYVHHDLNLPSNHNIVLSFKGERTILTHHQDWNYNLPDLDQTRWIYLTSLSPSFLDSNIVGQLVNYLERSGTKMAFQPGTFQLKQGKKGNGKLLSLSEVLILNLEEAKELLGVENLVIKKILTALADLGPKKVVVTDGKEGSFGFDGEKFWKLGVFPAKIVQVVGAGDAYSTGLVAGLIYGEELKEAMRWGSANASGVIEQIGSQAGLLTYPQLQERLKENSKIVAREI